MTVRQLLEGMAIKKIQGDMDREVKGIAYHSGRVQPQFLFVAIRGMESDGHRFVEEAIRRGAGAVMIENQIGRWTGKDGPSPMDVTIISVPNTREALARASARFYGNPSAAIRLLGVTGTKGKTTTTYLLESILTKAGRKVGVIGTINYRYGTREVPASNTTPESLDLQRILSEMVDGGVTDVIMEVSSHGLDLGRVSGCEFDGGIFTNFASDHLDYHKTLDDYFESKRKLFATCLMESPKVGRFAVTNGDDPRGKAIVEGIPVPVFRYGLDPSWDLSADQEAFTFEGLSCRILCRKGSFRICSRLIGEYNLYNILAALATGVALDLPLSALKEGVEAVDGVPGRFEKVENRKGLHVIVDYAHTRDALEQVLLGLKKVRARTEGESKIITVFGCGGDRDRTKRPRMGEVAGRYSDLCVLTSDNPRTEDPLAILDEVEAGFVPLGLKKWNADAIGAWRGTKGYLKIPDRRHAIRTAIRLARPGDVVLIAGKGHEDYQIVGKEKFPFDDRVEARKALEEA